MRDCKSGYYWDVIFCPITKSLPLLKMADPDGFSYLNNGRIAIAYLNLNVLLQFIFYF